MFLSTSMIVHPLLFFMCFIALTQSQGNTIGKVCGAIASNCAAEQTCVNGRCECDPVKEDFGQVRKSNVGFVQAAIIVYVCGKGSSYSDKLAFRLLQLLDVINSFPQ